MNSAPDGLTPASDAALAAALLAVDPLGLGGAALRAAPGTWRSDWLDQLRALLPPATPLQRLPLHASDTALLGGLDLAATLNAGRAVAQQGLLARADGGLVLLGMAERTPPGMAAHLTAVLDHGEVVLERDGLTQRRPARLALLAFDEGQSEDERLPAALLDRLAFHLEPDAPAWPPAARTTDTDAAPQWQRKDIDAARALLPQVSHTEQSVQALCACAIVLGVASMRAPLLALRVARAAAALTGQTQVDEAHTTLAARLVLAPRATQLPQAPAEERAQPPEAPDIPETPDTNEGPPEQPPENAADEAGQDTAPADDERPEDAPSPEQALQEMVVQAALAAIPPGLLAALKAGEARAKGGQGGRAGAVQKNQSRGRPVGTRRSEPRAGARLHVLDTLRAAAPWQKLRQSTQPLAPAAGEGRRIQIRREDFHVMRFKQNRATTTLFVVDASGSSALHRLAEAKGAVELLLADCYVRRDRVAVLAFRGQIADLLLPPTRSLARAKRSLAALPGGGGTPLATGMDAARELAGQIGRQGDTPVVVLLTDGRANIARDGTPGRTQAGADALLAARQFKLAGLSALLIDTSPQPQAVAQALAQAMGAAYVPLPFAGAQGLSQAVRLAAGTAAPTR
jgi:magnesium chelatase subunit D